EHLAVKMARIGNDPVALSMDRGLVRHPSLQIAVPQPYGVVRVGAIGIERSDGFRRIQVVGAPRAAAQRQQRCAGQPGQVPRPQDVLAVFHFMSHWFSFFLSTTLETRPGARPGDPTAGTRLAPPY